MKPKILETNRAELIAKRFRIVLSMLEGKRDISTGRQALDICDDVDLSPASVRTFLNRLCALGHASKKFIPMGHNPLGMGWPSHNEYTLTATGLRYVAQQLEAWLATSEHDAELARALRSHLDKGEKSQLG